MTTSIGFTVESFIKQFGGQYRETRTGWLVQCPYPDHADVTPSCSVSFHGLFYCFGCGKKGNFVQLLHDIAGMTWEKARLVAPLSTGVLPLRAVVPRTVSSTLAEMGWFDVDWFDAWELWVTHAHEPVHPPWAMPFNRGITPEVLTDFQVGYDSEHQWLIIPVFDDAGQYAGRINRPCVSGGIKYAIEPGLAISEHVFNGHRNRDTSVTIVEGLLDVLWVKSRFPKLSVVSCFSVHISARQTQLLLKHHTHFTLFFDGDEAGRRGAQHVAQALYLGGGAVDILDPNAVGVTDLKTCTREQLDWLFYHPVPYPTVRIS